jgi:hypothetical protein
MTSAMRPGIWAKVLLMVVTIIPAVSLRAQLYVATGSGGGTDASASGQLYTVDPSNASNVSSSVSLLLGGQPIGITGLVFDSSGSTLYGVTSNNSANNPNSLVTINPTTGAATLIGSLGTTISDITYHNGTLYGWNAPSTTGLNLMTISLATGATTSVGNSGLTTLTRGGGLAISPTGTMLVAPSATGPLADPPATGQLYTIDFNTGAVTNPGTAPVMNGSSSLRLNSLAYDTAGALYGVLSEQSMPNNTKLVTINSLTGQMTYMAGTLPSGADAIAFAPIPEPGGVAAGFGAAGLAAAIVLRRRKLKRNVARPE